MAERAEAEKPTAVKKAAPPTPKAKKLTWNEQREYDGIEAAILAAEEKAATCEAAIQEAATKGHAALSEACAALDAAKAEVERLYVRWQELEAKRG